jgi:hypothetical protein
MRRDAKCCSPRCRQALHRFTTDVGRAQRVEHGVSIRLAYADPPYPGKSARYYRDHPDYAGEVNHAELIERLVEFDGWALSTSASALPDILALCPAGVRVAAWVRGGRGEPDGPLNIWEPVIYFGGRARPERDALLPADATRHAGTARRVTAAARDASHLVDTTRHHGQTRRVDVLVKTARPRTTDEARVIGAKPATFCRWVFDLLGAEPQDLFSDIFPGSGGVTRAWNEFSSNL